MKYCQFIGDPREIITRMIQNGRDVGLIMAESRGIVAAIEAAEKSNSVGYAAGVALCVEAFEAGLKRGAEEFLNLQKQALAQIPVEAKNIN